MTEQDLIDAGYRKVTVEAPADRGYERKVTQEEVPLYNILVSVYDLSKVETLGLPLTGIGFSCKVFLHGHANLYMDATLHNAQILNVEQMEQWCDRMHAAIEITKP